MAGNTLVNYKIVQDTDVILAATVNAAEPITALGAASAVDAAALGLSCYNGVSGDLCRLGVSGEAEVVANAAIAIGAKVSCGGAGKFKTTAAGVVVGIAKTAAAADGDKFILVFNFTNL